MRQVRSVGATALVAVMALGTLVACGDDGDGGTAADEPEHRVVTYEAHPTAAPDEYDRVTVVEQGPEDAENVLVLAPGTSAGAGYFLPLAADLTRELEGWQVWSIDRRENLLEDHSRIDARKADDISSQETFDYYLGWLVDETVSPRFEPPGDEEVAFARDWGMEVAVEDIDVVVQEAKALGGDVVLGGHSLGATITLAYATWDFDGTPGGDHLAGIVLVDGGSAPASADTVDEAEAALADLAEGNPFNDLLGLGVPWAPGVFNVLGSTAVLVEPDEPSLGYEFPLLPEDLKPPVPPTNEAQYGYALDVDTSPDYLGLVHLNLGELADEGEPRGWVDDSPVPIRRAATMFSGIDGIDGTAWYHPLRLTIDGGVVNGGVATPAQDVLGVRAIRGPDLALSIYAFETGFGANRVLAAAEAVAREAGIPDTDLTLVERHDVTHTDPMGMEPDNPLVDTLVPFLRSIAS